MADARGDRGGAADASPDRATAQATSPDRATAPDAVCANCGATLRGRFCHACGQEATRVDTLRAFLGSALGDVANLDSRAWHTVRAMFVPGRLTGEYLRGRRARYLTPVQLYVLAGALFFAVNAVRPFLTLDAEHLRVVGSLGTMIRTVGDVDAADVARLRAQGIPIAVFAERFRGTLANLLPPFLVLVVVLFGAMLAAAHALRERNLVVHGVFALHWTALYLVITALQQLLPTPVWLDQATALLLLLWLAFALRRVYGQSWPVVGLKAVLLFLGFVTLLALWTMAGLGVALRAA